MLFRSMLLAESGIVRTLYFLNGGDAHDLHWETDSFAEVIENWGDIHLSCKPFGAFSRLESQGRRIRYACTISGLIGRDVPKIMEPVLTICGSTRGLVLDDQSSITGKVVLDYGPVVRGKSKRPIPGSEKWVTNRISPRLPFDSTSLDTVFETLQGRLASSLSDKNAVTGDITLSRANDTLLKRNPLVVLGSARIEGIRAEKATIIAAKTITVGQGALLKGCMLIGDSLAVIDGTTEKSLMFSNKKIPILGGTHGSQFFSLDSIIISKAARPGPMSLWVSKRTVESDTIRHGGILFEARGVYRGCAICYSDTAAFRQMKLRGPGIVIGDKVEFSGYLICDGDIEISPSAIQGHIWAQSVTGVDGTIKALHWLYRTTLKPLDTDLPFPLLGEMPVSVKFDRAAVTYRQVK